jgi:eukaryotic-like serine/threonine-protein kinase
MAVRKVGTCRVTRELGRGGMSVVYEAYQEALDRKVAVKALDAVAARSDEACERFRREGRAYAQIHHAAIIAVHDLVEKDEALYLVTEYVDGVDLHRLLTRGGALPPACVAAIGARVADALDCIHAHSMLHRDVKPGNLMVSRKGAVKVMDFGIVKEALAEPLTRTGTVVGTPYYLAPEVLGGDGEDERSDIWALGVTLYELATGERPFQGADYQALFAAVRKGRLRPVRDLAPEVPRRLARIIERCLDKQPERRGETAAQLAAELTDCARRLLGDLRPEQALADLLAARGLAEVAPPAAEPDGEPARTEPLSAADELPPLTEGDLAVLRASTAPRRTGGRALVLLLALFLAAAAWAVLTRR